ncbi:putative cytochrome p450 [Xylaria castorea]|nr:putative cytochrome p450 [Xylaria castorea]
MSSPANITATVHPQIPYSHSSYELNHVVFGQIVTSLLILLVLWRIWKFTLFPLLHPDLPKELPYWIPCHGLAFFQDPHGLISRSMRYFNNTGKPFALTAFGMTFYVVTQAKQSAEVFKNTETLSFERFVQGLMRINGNNEHAIKAMYTPLSREKPGFPNPQGESLGVLAQKMHIRQLNPGNKELIHLQQKVRNWIDSHLKLHIMSRFGNHPVKQGPTYIEVPLYQWTSELFVCLGQDVYFGEALKKINPGVPQAFMVFDELIWKMLYQYPRFLSRDMATGRTEVINALCRYLRTPIEERSDAAWLISAMETEMKEIGLETIFWVLTYLLHNPPLLAAYLKETEPAFDCNGALVDPSYIQNAENCPQVDAIWHETLRMVSWSASIRFITKDTLIGDKLLPKGHRVIVPHRLQHFDEAVFGANTHEFHPERWLHGGKDLTRNSSWHPFGAGKTMCSGRFLARFSVTTFVATVLQRFDISLVGNPPFPQGDEGRPVLGIISIKEGEEFTVRLTAKSTRHYSRK